MPGGRHQIGTPAGFKSESVAGFLSESMAGFVGIRTSAAHAYIPTAEAARSGLILEGQGQARLHLKSNPPWSHQWGPVHSERDRSLLPEGKHGGRKRDGGEESGARHGFGDGAAAGDPQFTVSPVAVPLFAMPHTLISVLTCGPATPPHPSSAGTRR